MLVKGVKCTDQRATSPMRLHGDPPDLAPALPREVTTFEIEVSFRFSDDESRVIYMRPP